MVKKQPTKPKIVNVIGALLILAGILYLVWAAPKHFTNSPTAQKTISTKNWPTYKDDASGFSIKYPKDAEVTHATQGATDIVIFKKTATTTPLIRIYANKEGFYGFEGLPQQERAWKNGHMVYVDDGLLGISHQDTYLTFEAGISQDARDILQAMVGTLEFK